MKKQVTAIDVNITLMKLEVIYTTSIHRLNRGRGLFGLYDIISYFNNDIDLVYLTSIHWLSVGNSFFVICYILSLYIGWELVTVYYLIILPPYIGLV